MKKAFVLACAGLGLVSAASAQSIRVDFNNVNPRANLTFSLVGGVPSSQTVQAGIYNWTAVAGPVTGPFDAYCIELAQYVPSGEADYNIVDLQLAPSPESTAGVGGMSPQQAVIVDALANFGLSNTLTNKQQATIQALIWEAVHEDPANVGTPLDFLDLNTGDFQITGKKHNLAFDGVLNGLDENGDPILVPIEESFELTLLTTVTAAINTANAGNYSFSTVALTSESDQDQVVLTGSVVPLPPAVFAALGVGAVLVPVARRRFTR